MARSQAFMKKAPLREQTGRNQHGYQNVPAAAPHQRFCRNSRLIQKLKKAQRIKLNR